jgi:rod shape-determining protein MreC
MVDSRGSRRVAILFFCLAFGVLLFGRWLTPVRSVAVTIAAPFTAVISGTANAVGDTLNGVVQGTHYRSENERLKQEIATLLAQNAKMQNALHQNTYLKTMLNFDRDNPHMSFLTADVIAGDPNTLGQYVYINRGHRDGLKVGMTVLSQSSYFAGTIVSVLPTASRVLLLSSPSSTVGAYDQSTRAQGVVTGRFGGNPQLLMVPTSARLRVGDFVLTSGQADLFPRGLVLGQIVAVHRQNVAPDQTAEIKPATDFGDMEVVQVIKNFMPAFPAKLPQGS